MNIRDETFAAQTKTAVSIFIAPPLKPIQATIPTGEIGGFPISIQKLDESANLLIHGRNTYRASVSHTPLGTISSLEHALNSLDTRLKTRQEERTDHLAKRESLGKHLDQSFEYEEQLGAATTRQQEILTALDLTKNQASVNVDEGVEDVGEVMQVQFNKAKIQRETRGKGIRVA